MSGVDRLIGSLADAMTGSAWLAPLLALAAGVLTSLTPCSLSTVPLIVGYVGGADNGDRGRALRLSLTFAAGMAVTFTALGTAASLLGRIVSGAGRWWFIFLGILMILMALQTWEIFQFIPSTYLTAKNKRRGYWGALLAGILGGVFSSPCATPMLVVLLGVVAGQGSLAWGILLLLLYAAGNSVLTVVAGTSYGFVRRLSASKRFGKASQVLRIVTGLLILTVGLYMFYQAF